MNTDILKLRKQKLKEIKKQMKMMDKAIKKQERKQKIFIFIKSII